MIHVSIATRRRRGAWAACVLTAAMVTSVAVSVEAAQPWSETKIVPSAPSPKSFGEAVDVSGRTMVVRSSAGVSVYERSRSGWAETALLTDLAGVGFSESWSRTVGVSGNTIVVGSPNDDTAGDDAGALYIFTRTMTGWSQPTRLVASDATAGSQFGSSVGISDRTIVVGAPFEDGAGDDAGSAYVFRRSASGWVEAAQLTASETDAGDWFGFAVDIDAETIVVGAWRNDTVGVDSGSAHVFTRIRGRWFETAELTASDASEGARFGLAVAIDGDSIVVGAPVGSDDFGAAYVFTRSSSVWNQVAVLRQPAPEFDWTFGFSVAVEGNVVVVGAPFGGYLEDGVVYVFRDSPSGWVFEARLMASDTEGLSELLGWSVAISDSTVVAGARWNHEAGPFGGAVYLFTP